MFVDIVYLQSLKLFFDIFLASLTYCSLWKSCFITKLFKMQNSSWTKEIDPWILNIQIMILVWSMWLMIDSSLDLTRHLPLITHLERIVTIYDPAKPTRSLAAGFGLSSTGRCPPRCQLHIERHRAPPFRHCINPYRTQFL